MTDERPMTISRVCDRLFIELAGAWRDSIEHDPYGGHRITDTADVAWYQDGLRLADRIEAEEKDEQKQSINGKVSA